MGISTVQSLPSSRAISGRGCIGPFMICGLIPANSEREREKHELPVRPPAMCLVVMEITAFGQSYEYILFNSLWENILYSAFCIFTLHHVFKKDFKWELFTKVLLKNNCVGDVKAELCLSEGMWEIRGLARFKWAVDTSNRNTNDMLERSLHQSGRNQRGKDRRLGFQKTSINTHTLM